MIIRDGWMKRESKDFKQLPLHDTDDDDDDDVSTNIYIYQKFILQKVYYVLP